MYSEAKSGLIVLVILGSIVLLGLYNRKRSTTTRPDSSIVETRREHLVFHADGCNVFQVRIEDEDGVRFIYIAVNPAASKRPTTAYATCRLAH